MNPPGMRQKQFRLGSAEAVHVYSDAGRIVLQLRKSVPTEIDVVSPSFKVAVELSDSQAVSIAAELVQAATTRQSSTKGVSRNEA